MTIEQSCGIENPNDYMEGGYVYGKYIKRNCAWY